MKLMALPAVVMCLYGVAALYYGWGLRSSDPYLGTWCVPFPKDSGHLYCDGIPQWQVFVGAGVAFLVAALVQLTLMVLKLVARQRGSSPAASTEGKGA